MKIIITEEQLNLLIEGSNPCPKGVVVNKTVTVDDLNKGVKISKGYCDPKSNSGLVKVQTLLKNKGYLGPNDPVGYFGDKTLSAICKLWGLTSCDSSVKLGKKTLDKLQGKTVTFIPTACIPEDYKEYMTNDKKALESLGLRIDELDISFASLPEITEPL